MRRSNLFLAALCALSAVAMGEPRKSPQNLNSSNPLQGMVPAGGAPSSPPGDLSVAAGQETGRGVEKKDIRPKIGTRRPELSASGEKDWTPNAKPDNGGQTADGNASGANPGASDTSARHIPFHNKSAPSAKREASGAPGGRLASPPVSPQTPAGMVHSLPNKDNAKNSALQQTREGNAQPVPESSGNAPVQQAPERRGRPDSPPMSAAYPEGTEEMSNQTREIDRKRPTPMDYPIVSDKHSSADAAPKPGPTAHVANVARPQVAENARAHDVRAVIACWDPGEEALANALAKQLAPAVDAIASGAKLTKADAARGSNRRDDVMIEHVAEVLEQQRARGERKGIVIISVTPMGTAPATTAGAKQNAEKCEPPCWTVTNELGSLCMCLLDPGVPPMDFGPIPDAPPFTLPGHLKGGSTGSTGGRLSSSGGAAATPHLKGETEDETTGRRMHRDWIVFVVNGKNLPSAELARFVQQSLQAEMKNPSSQRIVIKMKSSPRE